MKRVLTLVISIALLVGIGGISWSGGQGLGIKWGILSPLTGPFATLAEKQKQGAILALEELKAGGGPFADLEWFIEDTELNPEVAKAKAKELITGKGVQFITGCISSSSALAVRDVIDQYEVFFNPTAGANEITTLDANCSRYVFRAELMSWQGVSALAHLVKDLVEKGELGTRYWLLIPKGPYGYSMRDA